MNTKNPDVDVFIQQSPRWQAEMEILRGILLDCGLDEALKWGKPCYALGTQNVAILQPFKDYCALGFFKGALLRDPRGLLASPGAHSQAMRQLRFTCRDDIERMNITVKAYVLEAIDVEKAGRKVQLKETADYAVPEELARKFSAEPAFKAAFHQLTPGRQRAYLLFFSAAKQSATRASRIEKCRPWIFEGRGLNER
jgi:uncharacterized protein YdeI (YjbR/CyaY-like superfamily)